MKAISSKAIVGNDEWLGNVILFALIEKPLFSKAI